MKGCQYILDATKNARFVLHVPDVRVVELRFEVLEGRFISVVPLTPVIDTVLFSYHLLTVLNYYLPTIHQV